MRKIRRTNKFKKDYKDALKRGISKDKIQDVIARLANDEPLPERCRDHKLSGTWSGYRECHIMPDWLLIYKIDDDIMVLALIRMGTHSDLFGL